MDRWEEVQRKITREKDILDNIEDDYYRDKKNLEEAYDRLTGFRQGLYRKLEEKNISVLEHLATLANIDDDSQVQVNRIFEKYYTANEAIYRERLTEWEEELDWRESKFKEDFRKQEDKLEALYAERRKIDWEEEDKRKGKLW